MPLQILATQDGSNTLFNPEIGEPYHSTNGAIAESNHVFIQAGLAAYITENSPAVISIFEVGLGTGLNVLLTYEYMQNYKNIEINYTAIEAFPIPLSLAIELGYAKETQAVFAEIHESNWGEWISISPQFNFKKIHAKLEDCMIEKGIDLIYFDAFAPDKQPELWTEEVFKKLFEIMNPKAILTTYSAKGQVRRNMIAAGLNVERLPGPAGKREMLRGIKNGS
ncbi:MAG: tRNA (5-methylaminomethyl-2-thiouridine)(34)-methyltransferase MnmD [Bacteroidetes bacterium]|nr:tRNA (5-methylaminomethyl-2-thiouridine)(34)-methyltransferase MnmD [Bacteroidota bacterium]